METLMSPKRQREQVSARLDPDVLEIVERVAEAERRPISNLVRNIVSDWAASRRTEQQREVAA
jgi:Ribbon-helix-helix protein, copG family